MGLRNLLLGLVLAAGMLGCSPREPRLIPEISRALAQEELHAWPAGVLCPWIYAYGQEIILAERSGKLLRFDVAKKNLSGELALPFPVAERIFSQDAYLALGEQQGDRWAVLDLRQQQPPRILNLPTVRRILALDSRFLAFISDQTLQVWEWPEEKKLASLPVSAESPVQCWLSGSTILLLVNDHIHRLQPAVGERKETILPAPPASGVLADDDSLYFGLSGRRLVKFSLEKNRIEWQRKLANSLTHAPLKIGSLIAVAPVDPTISFLNSHGSVIWWAKLDSPPRLPPLRMRENVALLLDNGTLAFVHPRSHQVVPFKLKQELVSGVVGVAGYLYFLQADDSGLKLLRVGNRLGVDIVIHPEGTAFAGQSLKISLTPTNLIRPRITAQIFADSPAPLLVQNRTRNRPAHFYWMPERAGRYRIRVSARANNIATENEIVFQVADWQEIVRMLIIRL